MEMIRIAAADDEESEARFLAERHHGSRAQGLGVLAEQRLLPVAQQAAARPGRAQKRRERANVGIRCGKAFDEAFALGLRRRPLRE